MAVNGKAPNAVTIVDVEEVYFQCGKAVLRSDLWNPEKRVPRGTFPSLGRVLVDQIKGKEIDAERLDTAIEERYRNALY
jgi:predicted pyridoxine 5'-phosphate oxidase superfamily flavin-nucleotide-binding protein